MDLQKTTASLASPERVAKLKEALSMVPSLAWKVSSKILVFTSISLLLNIGTLIYFYSTRSTYSFVGVLVPLLISLLFIVAMFFASKSYGIQSAIEHCWNTKKHVLFDVVASRTTDFLIKKKLPLTDEKTWLWLAEKPNELMQQMPGIVKPITNRLLSKIPLADFFSGIIKHKAHLSDDQNQTALLLSDELQARINPGLLQSSMKSVLLVLAANVLLHGLMFLLF
ncbi:MAG: hypothetical protein MUF42_12550 [Cytophagaceae bacterium]|jgi:hypothetical protein|nr:hypothetical protein [Cytophagaceae bacterium]